MDDAEISYRQKLGRQSKTLKAAVAEYRRRYKRYPPKGFDEWFAFAQANDFKMFDEFDGMMGDLEPFWSLNGEEIRRRTTQIAEIPGVDLVTVFDGNATAHTIQVKNAAGRLPSERANHFIMMMEPFLATLPDMQFAISTKSESRIIVPWESIEYPNTTVQNSEWGLQAVLGGKFIESWNGEGSVWDAFRRSCPPGSSARRLFGSIRGQSQTAQSLNLLRLEDAEGLLDPSRVGLVENPTESSDFCNKPSGRYLQGHFFSDYRTINALYPIFSPAKGEGFNDIVIPSHYYYGETKRYTYGRDPVYHIVKETDNYEMDWEGKENKIFWRGASTGGGSSPPGFLHQYQRHRLVRVSSSSTTENTTVIFPESSNADNTKYIQATVPAAKLNSEIFDVGFTAAIGCDLYHSPHANADTPPELAGGCDVMEEDLRFTDAVQLSDHWKYKYLIDLDGMGYSAHFLAFMASESAVLKSTVYREFFSDWIQPWLHYIPVSQTYNDLYNIHAYFSGPSHSVLSVARNVYTNLTAPLPPPDGTSTSSSMLGEHEGDRRLRQIARAGRHWKKTQTRRVDQEIYVYRLCLEWARLWSDERDSMVYRG
ncbi:hypothetical protein DL93DRAFT_2125753 [Clavulina sp. PMI_390]|nr:hypothetical protein DL93DRAFT_2125753 [Clavulina sp. PMI_390]